MATRFPHGSLEMRRSVDKLCVSRVRPSYDKHRDDALFFAPSSGVSPASAATQNWVRNCSETPYRSSVHPSGTRSRGELFRSGDVREGGETVLALPCQRSAGPMPKVVPGEAGVTLSSG